MILYKTGETFNYKGKKYTIGAEVIGADASNYAGLLGTILEIRDGEDKNTNNETPEIYCCFDKSVTPYEIQRLEKIFSELYQCPKPVSEIILDQVIVAPNMIKTIEKIENNKFAVPIFIITEDWAENDESDINVWLAEDICSAKLQMRQAIKDAIEMGGIFDRRGEEDIEENSSDLFYEIYRDGWYCETHYTICIEEKCVNLSKEFIKHLIAKFQKSEDSTDES